MIFIMKKAIQRYHSLSIMLHWFIVLAILFMFASGLYMVNVDISKADQYRIFQIHKASGVVVLWAMIFRVGVRISTCAPALPDTLNQQQVFKAKLGHILLYVALVTMPLSGWLMVSASPFGLPTFVFVDWIKWPHIPGVARNKAIETLANNVHWITASLLATLIVGHVSALVWHQKKHNLNLIRRMWWIKE
jgi:cytochrome b561